MMKKVFIFLGLIFILGCENEKKNIPENFDFGKVEGFVYSNNFFKFKIASNPDWYLLNQTQLNNVIDEGLDFIADNNSGKIFKQEVEASKVNIANLFGVYHFELGSTLDFNPSLSINAENLKDFPEIKKIEDYLIQAKDMMNQAGMNLTYKSEDEIIKIGSKVFIRLNIENNTFGIPINQEFYSTLINNFAFNLVISYQEDEDKKELHKMLSTLKFY